MALIQVEKTKSVKIETVKLGGGIFFLECKCTNPTGTEYKGGEWHRGGMKKVIPNIGVDYKGYMACCKKCGYAPWIISPRRS